MTRLNPNGWRVNGNDTHVIELVRPIDKGEWEQEVITAEKSIRTGIWNLQIIEATNGHQITNTVRNKTFPEDDRDDIITRINEHVLANPGDQY